MGVTRRQATLGPHPTQVRALQVSIIVNNYNYGQYLGQAIQSALDQTHPDTEVIVVDDGSTDGSRGVLEEFEHRVVTVLKPNGGQGSSFNAGLEASRGEVIIFLDADDVLSPDAARWASDAMQADDRVARVQWRMSLIDGGGAPLPGGRPPAWYEMASGDLRTRLLSAPFDNVFLPTSGNAFRARFLRAIFPIPEREYGVIGADWYVVHLSSLLGNVRSLDETLASYRIHGGNLHQVQDEGVDLEQLRRTIGFQQVTCSQIARLADELSLERPGRLVSLSNVLNRLISLRLDPQRHPVRGDSRLRLVLDGGIAIRRREDVGTARRVMMFGWCLAWAITPRPLLGWLIATVSASERSATARISRFLRRRERRPQRT